MAVTSSFHYNSRGKQSPHLPNHLLINSTLTSKQDTMALELDKDYPWTL